MSGAGGQTRCLLSGCSQTHLLKQLEFRSATGSAVRKQQTARQGRQERLEPRMAKALSQHPLGLLRQKLTLALLADSWARSGILVIWEGQENNGMDGQGGGTLQLSSQRALQRPRSGHITPCSRGSQPLQGKSKCRVAVLAVSRLCWLFQSPETCFSPFHLATYLTCSSLWLSRVTFLTRPHVIPFLKIMTNPPHSQSPHFYSCFSHRTHRLMSNFVDFLFFVSSCLNASHIG